MKRVFQTLLPHFPWRRARSMIFSGKLEQTLTLPTVETASLWLVWMLRKRRRRYHPSFRKNQFFGVWYEILIFSYFLTGKCLFIIILPCCNLVCAFAPVFNEKSAILSAKVAKTSFLAFLRVFIGTRASALCINPSPCKNRWKATQNL